jgi:hypothetical protein
MLGLQKVSHCLIGEENKYQLKYKLLKHFKGHLLFLHTQNNEETLAECFQIEVLFITENETKQKQKKYKQINKKPTHR